MTRLQPSYLKNQDRSSHGQARLMFVRQALGNDQTTSSKYEIREVDCYVLMITWPIYIIGSQTITLLFKLVWLFKESFSVDVFCNNAENNLCDSRQQIQSEKVAGGSQWCFQNSSQVDKMVKCQWVAATWNLPTCHAGLRNLMCRFNCFRKWNFNVTDPTLMSTWYFSCYWKHYI